MPITKGEEDRRAGNDQDLRASHSPAPEINSRELSCIGSRLTAIPTTSHRVELGLPSALLNQVDEAISDLQARERARSFGADVSGFAFVA